MTTKKDSWTVLMKIMLGLLLIPLGFSGFQSVPASTLSYDVYLQGPNSIPSYCQEVSYWCGAATGQMILEGYPPPYAEHPYSQTIVWDTIQIYKDDPGVNWATDPDGLRGTLMDLGYEPGVNWAISAVPDKYVQTFAATYWMAVRRFPVATLVWGWAHWVVIIGFTTDVDPRTNPDITLEMIEIINPWNPPCPTASYGGEQVLMTGTNWLTNYWDYPGNYPASKWNGNFLAVIEPPPEGGTAHEEEGMSKMPTGDLISPTEAVNWALIWIDQYNLDEKEPYSSLDYYSSLTPLLVNEEYDGYYIVPFGVKNGQEELCYAALLVNAYDGSFQEVGYFNGNAIEYLTETQAVSIARSYWNQHQEEQEEQQRQQDQGFSQGYDEEYYPADGQLIFMPAHQVESRYLAVWKVTAAGRSPLYVKQDGGVLVSLSSWPLGD